jgi:hypothetical protein
MTINTAQVAAFGRHVLTFALGAVAFAGAAHFLTPDDAAKATGALGQISAGVGQIWTGFATLAALGSALYASLTASSKNQINAVAANPQVKQIVVADKPMADSFPSPKVIAPPPVVP